jgi:carbon-monoxide dehydrogenase medium subunit
MLAEYGDDAKVLAGGQSLVPLLAMRLTYIDDLVDVGRIGALQGISVRDSRVEVKATTRHADLERDALAARELPLAVQAVRHVAHTAIRNRGTVGGSIAHADPAAELPAVAVALRAEIEATSLRGTRQIPAREFFLGHWTTALEPDEILTAVSFPTAPGQHVAVEEVARRSGDFAITGTACSLVVTDGVVTHAGLALFGMGSTPVAADAAEAALVGTEVAEVDPDEVAELAIRATEPPSDIHADAAYRRRVGRTITAAALRRALYESHESEVPHVR